MKTKILFPIGLILSLTIFFGCEKENDNVIESQISDYQVVNVIAEDSVQYPINLKATFSIEFNKSDDIKNVKLDVYSPDNIKTNSGVQLLDNGNLSNGDQTANDDVYSGQIELDSNQINGNYEVKLYVTDRRDNTKQVATAKYYYNNGKSNAAPIISDDVINPDTVTADTTVVIWCTINASDPNGREDISKVYFIVYKPDGSSNNTQIDLFDNGNVSDYGDLIANDGIYSRLISVNQTNDKGTYRFEFRAKDRSNKLSNIINHSVLIQ